MNTSIDTTRGKLLAILNSDDRASHEEDIEVILAEYVVIPRSELPEVDEYEDPRFGTTVQFGSQHFRGSSAQIRRQQGPQFLALAEHLEARESEAASAEAKRNARRDELVAEMMKDVPAVGTTYASFGLAGQRAIDMIIELEDAAS